MRPVFLLLFLLTAATGRGQSVPPFRIDSLPVNGVLLNKGWKWHAGDNPQWAKPEFDDAQWAGIDPTKDIHDLPQVRKAQIGWFRLKVQVDSTLLRQALALVVGQVGASEIYLDGRLIYRLGVVSTISEQEQTTNLMGEVYSFHLNAQLTHQLAIRYSFTTANFYHNISGFGNPCLALTIQSSNQAHTDQLYNNLIPFVLDFVLAAIYLLLGVTFLFFYFSFNTQKPYLFFGLSALGELIAYIFYILQIRPTSTSFAALCNLAGCVITLSGVLFLLVGAYALYARPKNWVFYGLVGYAVLSVPAMLLFYKHASLISAGFYLIFNLDQLRQYWYGMKARQAGARTLFISILIFYVFLLLSLALQLAGQGGMGYVSISIGLFVVPLGFSLFLAGEFARTAHTLRKRVVEVEELSAENQQILTQQNETLEREVEARTTELNKSLTDLRATQTQLIQAEKMASLGELTAGIAHEIQNPLNFVNNFSEVSVEMVEELRQELDKEPVDKEYVGELLGDLSQNQEKIAHHGGRASSIVKGMLEHSRSSTGERQPTDLNALADEYLRLAYQGFRAKDKDFNCELKTDFDPDLGKVDVVAQEIGRVLLNLFNNAFYAVSEKKKLHPDGYEPIVSVSTQQLDGQVIIKVKDNGTGIPDAVKAKIFQPFFTTKPTGSGTGLGLSLAYDIVTKGHGGTIAVESAVGEGTRFLVKLPV